MLSKTLFYIFQNKKEVGKTNSLISFDRTTTGLKTKKNSWGYADTQIAS
jgi:hypothetical protein